MSNQKSLEKYLIGEVGYLKSDISNGNQQFHRKWYINK
jgi:hypothetical protein